MKILIKIHFLDVRVTAFKRHPKYKRVPRYDIAYLATEEVESPDFLPICITNNRNSLLGYRGYVVSWSPTKENDEIELLGTEVTVVLKQYCKNLIYRVPNHTYCMLHGHKGSWLCLGDSGAGFFIRSNDKRYFLYGIVSSGLRDENNNCTVENYVLFSDVTKFYSFITEKT